MKVYLLQLFRDYGDREWSVKTIGIFSNKEFLDEYLKTELEFYPAVQTKIKIDNDDVTQYQPYKNNGWAYEHWYEVTELEPI